ncbi:MAG TPA: ABC transporter substrate-binding protein, partial [Myxococcota bacterium]|nr:ABC transporter substrate-binding protein [Myxococcota bacterium]
MRMGNVPRKAILIVFFSGLLLCAGFLLARLNKSELWHAEPQDFKRIVSLAPSYTDVIEALGQGDRLVGITAHCRASGKKSIGTFADANFEAIMELKPDLILAV